MTTSAILTVLIGTVSVSVAGAAFFAATRATRSQARSADHAVDAGAFARATDIYESTIAALRAEVARLTEEVQGARTELRDVRSELSQLRVTNDRLIDEMSHLRSQEHDELTVRRDRDTGRLSAYDADAVIPPEPPV